MSSFAVDGVSAARLSRGFFSALNQNEGVRDDSALDMLERAGNSGFELKIHDWEVG